ncbi:uncharacterized protein LOC125179487 [Hyalella azteca]|uniref:Uncharacterized protein LOC125179487 n=1 Tax=Hyalella azteca TaxID=294128 RepID=A0A979FVX2_HYAAZ|nr:uncharacterized protein LOC125179487 [Hyalella azteca]
MLRTPTHGDEPEVPSGKLGAVTRKRNEIEELLILDPPPYDEIRKLFNEYLTKVEHLYAAALDGNHNDWLAPHKIAIDNFREKVELALSSLRKTVSEATPSVKSSSSSTSSVRIKLAQRKAKLAAEKVLLEKSSQLDQEEIQLKIEQLRLERNRKQAAVDSAELENKILEEELDLLDAAGSVGGSETSSSSTGLPQAKTNSPDVLAAFQNVSRVKPVEIGVNDHVPSSKALGLTWEKEGDHFTYSFNYEEQTVTRRSVLRTVASVYDPLGMILPVLIIARKIFQETCRLRLAWDDPLPASLLAAWNKWTEGMKRIANYRVPRCIGLPTEPCRVELHVFCDGSEVAYGSVAYVTFLTAKEIVVSSPVLVKARLTPLGNSTLRTVPRIELCAAKLSVDLFKCLAKNLEFNYDDVFFWTDSTTVLGYICNETKRFHRFVSNKISYIRSYSSPHQWKHVTSKLNPADLLSRGCTVEQLRENELWSSGPPCLRNRKTVASSSHNYEISYDDPEIKFEKAIFTTKSGPQAPFEALLDCSSWHKMKLRIAWFSRFQTYLRNGVSPPHRISLPELEAAEASIIKYVQRKEFPNLTMEIKNKLVKDKHLKKLDLFLDPAGLIRIGGRLKNAAACYSVRHPILLPSKSSVTALLVKTVHRIHGHLGKSTTMSILRKSYWIIGCSSLVKRIANACVICRKYQARAASQMMSDLPEKRVVGDVAAFTNVGLDYFGNLVLSRLET